MAVYLESPHPVCLGNSPPSSRHCPPPAGLAGGCRGYCWITRGNGREGCSQGCLQVSQCDMQEARASVESCVVPLCAVWREPGQLLSKKMD